MRSPYLAAFALSMLIPAVSFAQDDEAEGTETEETMEAGDASESEDAEQGEEGEAAATGDAMKVEDDASTPLAVRRGVFVSGDFGIYFRFGGTNTNSPLRPLPTRPTSNIQPYYGIVAGYDLVDTPDFALSGGLRFAMLLNGGSGTATANDDPNVDPNTYPNDYSVIQTGVAFKGSLRVADRVGLVFGLDGGLALLNPDPLAPAATGPGINGALPDSGGLGIGGIAGLSVGTELYTLLDGFTIGSNLRFTAIFAGADFIPGLAIEVVNFKYTF